MLGSRFSIAAWAGRIAIWGGVLSAASGAGANPVLSEVFYDAVGSDNGLSFVELYGTPGTSLDGLVLEGVNGAGGAVGPVVALAGVIPEDGFFVLADVDGAGETAVPEADARANFDFQNGPDSVVLRGAVGVLDALGYGSFTGGDVFAGEGQAAPDAPAGSSLARHFADVDTDDNAADFAVSDAPTPGFGPLAPVPEPGTGGLVALGLLGLALCPRARA
ncbi:MAG: PEP-CTERM sorting domain-containing protein [Proteobacteria bacterium]|nr:PEP-CTERM sorting domain-containing protein [Pseudomonadota bacterium]